MTQEHRSITDPEIHEIKGAATAIANSIPVASGSGGTTFKHLNELPLYLPGVSKTADYLSNGETVFTISTVTGAVILTLSTTDITSKAGKVFIVADVGNNAATNNITVATEGSENIQGSPSYLINTNGGRVILWSDGSNLIILSSS